MDSDTLKNIKSEKTKGVHRFKKMHMITSAAFRFVEFCMFLVIFWRFSTHLNVDALKLSGEYFRRLSVSPRFVFLVGNVIFMVLFLRSVSDKSGSIVGYGNVDIYEEYMGKNQNFWRNYHEEIIKKQGRSSISVSKERKIQRSRSESLKMVYCEEATRRKLRRSATVIRRKSEAAAPVTEEMSSEEFRRKVEDFIARQQRALREEEFSFVSGQSVKHS